MLDPNQKKLSIGLHDLNDSLDLQESDSELGLVQSHTRKSYYTRKACVMKVYSVCVKVLLSYLSFHSKLEGAWEGPCVVLELLSAVKVRIGLPGMKNRQKVVHINLLSPYIESDVRVSRMVMVVE